MRLLREEFLLLLLHCVAPVITCAAEGAAEQQQMVESIHAMIGDLEVEKQSFLATMNSQQVRCFCCMLVSTVKSPTLCSASCWDPA